MTWYHKMFLAFGGILLVFILLVIQDRVTSGRIIFKAGLTGDRARQQTLTIDIAEAGEYVLIIRPGIESGWGDPDVFLKAVLLDPDEKPLVSIDSGTVFGGIRPTPAYQRKFMDYEEKFTFRANRGGEFGLRLQVLSEHVAAVAVAVGCKGD